MNVDVEKVIAEIYQMFLSLPYWDEVTSSHM